MKRISLFVSERQYEQFHELGRIHGQPYAELIREALNQYLRRMSAAVSPQKARRKRPGHRRRR